MQRLTALTSLLPFALLTACAGPTEGTGEDEAPVTHQREKTGRTVSDTGVCEPTSSTVIPLDSKLVVFAVDRTEAMAPSWESVKGGLNAFFGDEGTTGIQASLHVFPNSRANEGCSASYAIPQVHPYALPNDALFARVLAANDPGNSASSTAALAGAIENARTQAIALEKSTAEIIFVTSGAADTCVGSSYWSALADEAKAAFQGTPSIRVHVIATSDVGDAANEVAKAGGTEKAVTLADDTSRAADLRGALSSMATPAERCFVDLPEGFGALAEGRSSLFIGSSQDEASFAPYSATCENGVGYRLDASNEHRIELCRTSCAGANLRGSIRLNSGCATGTDIVPTEDSTDSF